MELRQLRYVEAVARHRHFTRAAEELHVAQSALSHQVLPPEAELGVDLFERTSRRVVTTDAGRAVAERARRVLAEVEGVQEDIDEIHGLLRGRISIGALLPAGEIDVPLLLARFPPRRTRGSTSTCARGRLVDMLGYLAAEEVDAAFTMLAGGLPPGVAVEPLSEDEVVAAFTPGDALGAAACARRDLAPVPARDPAHPGPRSRRRWTSSSPPRPSRSHAHARERGPVPAALPCLRRLRGRPSCRAR